MSCVNQLGLYEIYELGKSFFVPAAEAASGRNSFAAWYFANVPDELHRPGCYAIYKRNECIYVGMSERSIRTRLRTYWHPSLHDHRQGREEIFNLFRYAPDQSRIVVYIPIGQTSAYELEGLLIKQLCPATNVAV